MCFGKGEVYGDQRLPRPLTAEQMAEKLQANPGERRRVSVPSSIRDAPSSRHSVSKSSKQGIAQSSNHAAWDVPPPPGPPPSKSPLDWQTAVPDTALFPDPPPFFSGHDQSHTTNAPEDEAAAGEDWCAQYPLARPIALDEATVYALRTHTFRLMPPLAFDGSATLQNNGRWHVETPRHSRDHTLVAWPPLYFVNRHDPTRPDAPPSQTIYFELKLLRPATNASVALGFTALPYPPFRLPGWHRGSLAVHSDDGHRFVNDRWGGKDFTLAFATGDTLGLGMTLSRKQDDSTSPHPDVKIFFTRNGSIENGWDLHEETDAQDDLPVTGLEGFHDLACAVGTFGKVDFEVIFDPQKWFYKGIQDLAA